MQTELTPDTLKTRRKALGLAQADLAADLGVTRETVVRWERGTMEINAARMLSLALDTLEGNQTMTTATAIRRLTGRDAVDYAEATGSDLNLYANAVDDARDDLDIDDARAIASEDPSLVWIDIPDHRAEIERYRITPAASGSACTSCSAPAVIRSAGESFCANCTEGDGASPLGYTYALQAHRLDLDLSDDSALDTAAMAAGAGMSIEEFERGRRSV